MGMTPSDYARDVRHFVVSTEDVDLPFHLGDAVSVFPENPTKEVEAALKWFGYDADAAITLEPLDDTLSARMLALGNQRTTARQLLTEILDLVGKPTRSFYQQFSLYANATEAKELVEIGSGAKFTEFQDASLTHWDSCLACFPPSSQGCIQSRTVQIGLLELSNSR